MNPELRLELFWEPSFLTVLAWKMTFYEVAPCQLHFQFWLSFACLAKFKQTATYYLNAVFFLISLFLCDGGGQNVHHIKFTMLTTRKCIAHLTSVLLPLFPWYFLV